MNSDLRSILINLVSTFIYAGIVWLWKKRGSRPTPVVRPAAPPVDIPPLDRRARNRQAAERTVHQFLFYFVTFAALYLSVTCPPLFKALFAKSTIFLSDARFIGDSLPSVPIGKEYLQFAFFIVAAILYWPLLFIAEFATSLLYPMIDAFRPVTERIWSATLMLVFLVICIPVSATSIWLFYEKTFQESLMNVVFFLFLAFVIGQAQNGRR